MKRHLDTILSVALTLAAVTMATAFTWRQFSADSTVVLARSGNEFSEPKFYPGWRAWIADGTPLYGDSAPVAIIEFSDFECSFCGRFHEEVLKRAKASFGSQVAVFFLHLPLNMHRFAEISAVAAECAEEQDRFVEFVEVVFQKQDSIGLKSWALTPWRRVFRKVRNTSLASMTKRPWSG